MTCIGCERTGDLLNLTDKDIELQIEEQLSLEINIVSEELKNFRLAICKTCTFLSKHTCLKCGCYVGFRASLSKKVCPDGKW